MRAQISSRNDPPEARLLGTFHRQVELGQKLKGPNNSSLVAIVSTKILEIGRKLVEEIVPQNSARPLSRNIL